MHEEQPAPKPSDHPAVWDLVLEDIGRRDKTGALRYGTRLKAFNGRDQLRDLYEELLDAVVYIRAEMYQRDAKCAASKSGNDSIGDDLPVPHITPGFYRHFKGDVYYCLGAGRESEAFNDFRVIYLSLKHGHLVLRPVLSDPDLPDADRCGFTDFVVKDGYRGPRFRRVPEHEVQSAWVAELAQQLLLRLKIPPAMIDIVSSAVSA